MRLSLFLLALLVAFILDAPVHRAVSNAPEGVARAAGLVTWIGKTDWQALVLITVMLAASLSRPSDEALAALRLAVIAFLLILLTGIAVQALKFGFGRPRPENLGELSPMSFAPLSLRLGWNAFPSGHATTMGALAMLVCRVWPKACVYAWGVAVLVAVSRVLVGAHFPSDVVAGLALGATLAAWMLKRWDVPDALGTEPRTAGLGAIPRTFATLLSALVRPRP